MKSGQATKVLFMGTPDFAIPSLEALIDNPETEIIAVITQPDKPAGRNHQTTPPPIKCLAENRGILVLQPKTLRDEKEINKIKKLEPELIVVVAYGKIIPKEILKIPKRGVLNLHPSLLPKYRGASPIQSTIANGEKETGITIMIMDEEMDHGPILTQKTVIIEKNETRRSLFQKLAPIGADLLIKTISPWLTDKISPQDQDHQAATFCKLLERKDGKIDWSEPTEVIERKIRAYHPWPGTWTMLDGKRLNILQGKVIESSDVENKKPGHIFKAGEGFAVQCGKNALEIIILQPEGKKEMSASDFLRGHPRIIGIQL